MRMLPSVFGEDLFDSWMTPFDREFFGGDRSPLYVKHEKDIMKTDVKETADGYELNVDLPGFKKEDVKVELQNGYLTISAQKGLEKNDTNKENGNYIRRERYFGSCQRSFYVGDGVKNEDVHAKLEDGILRLTVPKKDAKQLPENRTIAIEG